jgi:hypothetical protein
MPELGFGWELGMDLTPNGGGPLAPENYAPPSITPGTAEEGDTVARVVGTWGGNPAPTFTYQWKRDGSNISGATGTTYTTVSADVGTALTVTETATNSEGSASATSSAISVTAAGAPWLVATGVWNDDGRWDDSDIWRDDPP